MRGLLILLSALLLLESTDGNEEYNQLSQHEAGIVDKAIRVANQNYGTKHIDFAFVLGTNPDKKMLHVLLRSTSCDKKTPSVHRKDCVIQDKEIPQVSCIDCGGTMSCLLLKEKNKIKKTLSECSSSHHLLGAGHPLAQKTDEIIQTGCLGCI